MNRLEYQKEYQKKRIAEGKAYAMRKLGEVCANCGTNEELQFDHIEPLNDANAYRVAQMFTFSRAKLDAELEKCQLLCVPCHKQKSAYIDREHASLRHGTLSAYRYCKCTECKRAKSEHNKRARTSVVEGGSHKSMVVGSIPTVPTSKG